MARVIFDTSDFDRGMRELEPKLDRQRKKAVRDVAEDLLMKSQDLVPLDIGTLQMSGHTEHLPEESIVAYGGSGANYAAYQHEGQRRDGSHVVRKYTTPGRGRKYLEKPLTENFSHYQQLFGSIMAQILI